MPVTINGSGSITGISAGGLPDGIIQADDLASGVESGSERVRDHMKKQFSNQDLDEFVHEAHKNGVTLQFLMIIGYPTETHEDFLETLRMFKRYKKYDNLISHSTEP